MARILIDLDAGPLLEVLGRIRNHTSDLSGLMTEFQAVAISAINKRFKREGPGWQKHAPSTEARRGKGAPILRDKGRLSQSQVGGAQGFARVGATFMELGSNVKYAHIHNFGGEIKRSRRKAAGPDLRARKDKRVERAGKSLRRFSSAFGRPTVAGQATSITMPARRFLPTEEEIMPALLAAAEDYFEELLDG